MSEGTDSVKRRLTWDVQEGGLQEGLWHGVHSQPELTGRRCAGDPCSVYAESSHSLGPGFCVTPEAQCVLLRWQENGVVVVG